MENVGGMDVPSKLLRVGRKPERIQRKLDTIKKEVLERQIPFPAEYVGDEHFWDTTTTEYAVVNSSLQDAIPDKITRRTVAFSLAVRQATEYLYRERMGATDPLTGTWNRGALNNFTENLRSRPRRGTEIGLLMLDIDFFKKINDDHGHLAGDRVLQNLVRELGLYIRATDMVARYGGEEFVVVLPGMPNATAVSVKAEEIRKKIKENLGITVSIGATIIREEDNDINAVFHRMDQNMYTAKRSGRDATADDNGKIDEIVLGENLQTSTIKYSSV